MKTFQLAVLLIFGCGSASAQSVTIEYIAHASFRIVSPAGHSVMIDPYESRWWLGYDFPDNPAPVDAVLVSHPHSDHDGGIAAGREPVWLRSATIVGVPGTFDFGDIEVTGVRGKHADPYGKEFGQINTIWRVEVGGLSIVHVGDNGPITDAIVEGLVDVDILMLPIDDIYHILKHDEIETFRERLKPSILVPMHYRHYDLELEADSPSDLGELVRWLDAEDNTRILDSNVLEIDRESLPATEQVVVFRHAPEVRRPE